MLTYIGKRLFQIIPVLLGVVLFTFVIMRAIPGDPTELSGQTVSEEVRTALRARWHLDKPTHVQFLYYLKGIVQLDFGISMRLARPVSEMIPEYFYRTLQLGLCAFVLSVTLGLALGIISALMKDTWVDRSLMFFALLGISTPVFVVGIVLIIFAVSIGFHYISATSMTEFDIRYLVLPAITLGSRSIAYLCRMTRASILEVSSADFLRTARAKGLSERTVVFKHLMKNAMIPIITVIGLNFADYLTGAILTETVFQWPGLGFLMRTAILSRDIPVIMGAVLFTTGIFVLINFVVDLMYAFFDPRIRYA
jgi:ABC-type dipeptide/oligopeptide/nickel transport system permease component